LVGALARADDNAGGTAANARATAAAAEARSASMCCRTRSSIVTVQGFGNLDHLDRL